MINTTQATPAGVKIKIQLDKAAMLIRVELQSLLLSFGAPSTLVKIAATAWEDKLLIEDDQKAGSPQYYLPMMLVADFIDLTLDHLSTDSRTAAVQFRDASRALEVSVSEFSKLKQSKPQGYNAMRQWLDSDDARQVMHKALSEQLRSQPAAQNHAAPVGQ